MADTEDTPAAIRSALAYFQRGGLVEMTERTLAEMAAGRKVVECDADGVLALCSLASVAMVARAGRAEGGDDAPVTLTYTNWRGETAERTILPQRVWFGATDWHPEPQWLLAAIDVEKGAERDFALKDFGQPSTLTASLAEAEARAGRAEAAVERMRKALRHLLGVLEIAAVMPEAIQKVYIPRLDSPDLELARAALQETPHGR